MALEELVGFLSPSLSAAVLSIAIFVWGFLYAFQRPSLPKNAPPLTTEAWPIIGSMQFFTKRWDFFQRQIQHSPTGNFSFYAGDKPVIGMSGDESRRIFFEHKQLGFAEGYGALLGGSPKVSKKKEDSSSEPEEKDDFGSYFHKRLIAVVKGPILARGLPQLLEDVRARCAAFAAQEKKSTDPFDSIYRTVFQLTMRTVACHEIASDPDMLERVLKLFETIESTATPLSIMYSWMPLPSQFRRTYAGAQLYMILKNIIDKRTKEDRREDDALQYLLDQGDDLYKIITFVLGALFAGQLNSGINGAWMLLYLADDKKWHQLVKEEVDTVANHYCADESVPLAEKLMRVPMEAWENEFPTIDLVLKESIRLQLGGNAFRKNISGKPIPLNKEGTEVIPPDAFATYAVTELHHNPDIYNDHERFDPARYLPDRAEDKKRQYAWIGWGVSRHPCLGMRFAKLENNIITAFWVANFDKFELVDANGKVTGAPYVSRNFHSAHKPEDKVFVNYQIRED